MKSSGNFAGIARLGAAAMLAALSFSACSLIRGKPQAPPAGPVFPVVEAKRIFYEGRVVPPAAYSDGRLFFVTDLGHVHAVDVGSMAPAWEFRAPQPVSRPVGLGRDRVYVVDDGRGLHCLDGTGRILWRKDLDESVVGPLTEAGGWLCLGTEEGSLIALGREDGGEAWRFRAGHAVRTGAVLWRDRRGKPFLLCGGDEGKIYFLSVDGRRLGHMDCSARLVLPLLLEGDRLYAGVEGDALLCLNLARRTVAWRVRLAGRPATNLLSDAGRLFVLTAQGVLMCLDKKSGSILWWRTLSSRTAFDPAEAGGQVLAAALSDRLVAFRARDGRETGRFQADGEFRANPVWVKPWILSQVLDRQRQGEALLFLKKQVQAALNASKPSPLRAGEEVVFTVSVTGFRQPRFEFILKSAEEEKVVQPASASGSWTWYPEEEGAFKVVVRVTEGEEKEEAELDVQVVR